MKISSILLSVFFIAGFSGMAQVGINADNSPPEPSAMLDVKSANKGLLIPRVAITGTTDASTIPSPATSLLIYNTATTGTSPNNVTPGYYYWNGIAWNRFSVGANGYTMERYMPKWYPAGTLGYSLLIEYGGYVGIGTTPSKKLDISGELQATGTGNNYFAGTVGIGTSSPAASAAVDITSNMQGFLPPRMTLAHRNAIAVPVPGLIIFCTDCALSGELQVHNGTAWTNMNGTVSGCGVFTMNHVTGTVAPVNKTVTYGTMANIPGSPSKCWITRNLGAGKQADSVNENTETAAGWYWQFNRKQGYQYTTNRIPNTTWISSISENSDWITANDPCNLELGTAWRIPTYTEWYNVDYTGGWATWTGPWDSGLKLHAAGDLHYTSAELYNRGLYGFYWSSAQNDNNYGWYFFISSASSGLSSFNPKALGTSLRCLREICAIPVSSPTSGTHTTLQNSIIWNWNTVPGATGYKWSATNNYATATDMGTATTKTETGLTYHIAYTRYVWAYQGCGNSLPVSLIKIIGCGDPFTINHAVSGGVAPVNKTVVYAMVGGITGEPAKCWITSNLGSDYQATAVDDATEASAGWYWQFNRKQGYQNTGGANVTPGWTIPSINENSQWTTANDPCAIELGTTWRIPTYSEWNNVDATWANWNGPWGSGLKLHAAGYLLNDVGSLSSRGSYGYYWSSAQDGAYTTTGVSMSFGSSHSYAVSSYKAYGLPIRCLRDF